MGCLGIESEIRRCIVNHCGSQSCKFYYERFSGSEIYDDLCNSFRIISFHFQVKIDFKHTGRLCRVVNPPSAFSSSFTKRNGAHWHQIQRFANDRLTFELTILMITNKPYQFWFAESV